MGNQHVIASCLADSELAKAFSELVAERWDNFDITPFMVYLVDTCAKEALPYLAEQFNVAGLRGFKVTQNEDEQRELIKRAISLHQRIGTPWAIKEACRTVGFPIIILDEGVTEIPGGPESPEDWARVRVFVSTNDENPVTPEKMAQIRAFIEIYKPERSHLQRFGFFQALEDGNVFKSITEDLELQIVGDIIWAHVIIDGEGIFIYDADFDTIAVYIDTPNTGNLYVGGFIDNATPMESDIINLLLSFGQNPILENVRKDSTIVYTTPTGIMRSYIVVPTSLGGISELYDIDNDQYLQDILIKEEDTIIIEGIEYDMYYLQYLVPATGEKEFLLAI